MEYQSFKVIELEQMMCKHQKNTQVGMEFVEDYLNNKYDPSWDHVHLDVFKECLNHAEQFFNDLIHLLHLVEKKCKEHTEKPSWPMIQFILTECEDADLIPLIEKKEDILQQMDLSPLNGPLKLYMHDVFDHVYYTDQEEKKKLFPRINIHDMSFLFAGDVIAVHSEIYFPKETLGELIVRSLSMTHPLPKGWPEKYGEDSECE
jgi:hypothetical protein